MSLHFDETLLAIVLFDLLHDIVNSPLFVQILAYCGLKTDLME